MQVKKDKQKRVLLQMKIVVSFSIKKMNKAYQYRTKSMDHLQNALVKSLIFLYRGHEAVEQLTSFINSSLGHPFVFEIQLIKKHEQEIHEFSKGYLK
jgi:hypothetical protein